MAQQEPEQPPEQHLEDDEDPPASYPFCSFRNLCSCIVCRWRSCLQCIPCMRTPLDSLPLPETRRQPLDAVAMWAGEPAFTVRVATAERRFRVVALSDTHDQLGRVLDRIPDVDVLLHTGDFSRWHHPASDAARFNEQLGRLPHPVKIVIGGNHEVGMDKDETVLARVLPNATHTLQDSAVTVHGVKFYGAPWHRKRGACFKADAFGYPASRINEDKWAAVPDDTDVLLLHAPPYGVLDEFEEVHFGDAGVLEQIVDRVRPAVCSFGHIHNQHGVASVEGCPTMFVNAAMVNHPRSAPLSAPIVFEIAPPDA